MPRKVRLGFCLAVALLIATVFSAGAMAHHEGYPTEGFGGVKPHVAQAGYYISENFGVQDVYGYRSGSGAYDHGKGLALDFMTYSNVGLGNQIVSHLEANWAHYGISYIIWQQRYNDGSGWVVMEDRGDPTQNHMDHVHVSFVDRPSEVSGSPQTSSPTPTQVDSNESDSVRQDLPTSWFETMSRLQSLQQDGWIRTYLPF